MINRLAAFAAPALLTAGFAVAAGVQTISVPQTNSGAVRLADAAVTTAVAKVGPSKVAATMPSIGQVTGTVTFTQDGSDVKVAVDLSGFPPNTEHGFHIHAKGDLSAPDLSSAGGHWDAGGKP